MNNKQSLYNILAQIAQKYRQYCEVLGIKPTREGFYIYIKGVK